MEGGLPVHVIRDCPVALSAKNKGRPCPAREVGYTSFARTLPYQYYFQNAHKLTIATGYTFII